MSLQDIVLILLSLLSGLNLVMLLRLRVNRLESSLDLSKMEKELIAVINGKYQRTQHAEQVEEEIDRRIRALEHEIHNGTGIRQRLHKIEGTLSMLAAIVKQK